MLADYIETKIHSVVVRLVSKPEGLQVKTIPVGRNLDVVIRPDADDTGRVIGIGGSRFRALKTITRLAGEKRGIDIFLRRIPEPLREKQEISLEFAPRKDWPREQLEAMAMNLAQLVFSDDDSLSISMTDEDHDDMTFIEIHVGAQEGARKLRDAGSAISTLLEAAGLVCGRIIRAVILPDVVAQPDSADGRHTSEVSRE